MVKVAKIVANDNDESDDYEAFDRHISPEDATYLKAVRKKLVKLDDDLVELRQPVNKKQAEIAAVYAELRKKGYDSDVIKMQHKRGGKLDHNFTARWNQYAMATETDLPLFKVAE